MAHSNMATTGTAAICQNPVKGRRGTECGDSRNRRDEQRSFFEGRAHCSDGSGQQDPGEEAPNQGQPDDAQFGECLEPQRVGVEDIFAQCLVMGPVELESARPDPLPRCAFEGVQGHLPVW